MSTSRLLQERRALGRRGISPLIATVLLLAFAVAIGTMAVSYLVDTSQGGVCKDARISLEPAGGACYADGHVTLVVSNPGAVPLASAKLRFISNTNELEERQLSLALDPAGAIRISVEYQTAFPDAVRLSILPSAKDGTGEKFCPDKEVVTTLKICG